MFISYHLSAFNIDIRYSLGPTEKYLLLQETKSATANNKEKIETMAY